MKLLSTSSTATAFLLSKQLPTPPASSLSATGTAASNHEKQTPMTTFGTQAFESLENLLPEKNNEPYHAKDMALSAPSVTVIGLGEKTPPLAIRPHPAPHLESWGHLHKRVWQNPDGVEFRMEWQVDQMTEAAVANKVGRRIQPWFATNSHNHRKNRLADIQANIEAFVGFTKQHLEGITGYEIRVAALH